MKMYELVSWFQLEYPELVEDMRRATHHRTWEDKISIKLSGDKYNIEDWGEALNPYHLEGTIWEHTLLVCKQAENAPYDVQIAALLHDIGKPNTRSVNPKNGRVSFYNHDAVSAFMSLEILKREELRLSKEQQSHIFNLIALHTQIYKLSVEQLAAIGNLDLVRDLIHLGNADHEGRFHSHEGAEIPDLREIPFPPNGITGYTKEVVVLCGLPASGKSTWRRGRSFGSGSFHLVSRDIVLEENSTGKDYEERWKNANQKTVDRKLQEEFKSASGAENVVVDMTHMSKKSRRRSLSHFDSSYKKKCVVFLTDLPTLYLRNKERDGKLIDERVVDRMMKSFYPPSFEEFDEIEYVINDSSANTEV